MKTASMLCRMCDSCMGGVRATSVAVRHSQAAAGDEWRHGSRFVAGLCWERGFDCRKSIFSQWIMVVLTVKDLACSRVNLCTVMTQKAASSFTFWFKVLSRHIKLQQPEWHQHTATYSVYLYFYCRYKRCTMALCSEVCASGSGGDSSGSEVSFSLTQTYMKLSSGANVYPVFNNVSVYIPWNQLLNYQMNTKALFLRTGL